MKKLCMILGCIFVFLLTVIYIVGGKVGAVCWNAWIFIVAPASVLCFIILMVLFIRNLQRKKEVRWHIASLLLSVLLLYPVSILFGASILTYPRNYKDKELAIINPVKDSVALGGKDFRIHAVWPSECYAYDILKKPYDCNTKNLKDYGIYLADVMAPVDSTVIDAYDGEDDITPNTSEFKSSLGNYIYLQVDETKTYLILAHLEKGSVKVSKGCHVKQGDVIAKVGNSGTTSEPHLHLQHQLENPMDAKLPICAQGLPMKIPD